MVGQGRRPVISHQGNPSSCDHIRVGGVGQGLCRVFDNSLNSSTVSLNHRFGNSTHREGQRRDCHASGLNGPNSFVPPNVPMIGGLLADGGCNPEAINNTDPAQEPIWCREAGA